ncbi:MAG: hypothetical protein OXD44_08580, partial [Gammaproteobacteria bacterium]|nr:hypothetical protein [Gammaproteobacteria bacterium]
ATLPLSVHEGYAFMDRQGENRGREAFVQRRSGDNPDFPALQAMQSGTARPGAGPAGACLHRPPLRTQRRTSPVWGSGREQALVKDLERRTAAQHLAGAAVQAILDLANFFRRDPGQAGALREVLAHQAVGGFVQAPLPGMARSRKAEPCLQPGGDLPVTGELLAAVRSQGAHQVRVCP